MSRWLTQDTPSSVQVVPLDDLILHTESSACTCAPKVTLVDGPGHVVYRQIPSSAGPIAKAVLYQYVRELVVHEAMDGRE